MDSRERLVANLEWDVEMKIRRLRLYELHQEDGLDVKNARGKKTHLTSTDLKKCIATLKDEIFVLRNRIEDAL